MTTAIITKFHGPTNRLGARISATTATPRPSTGRPDRLYISYDHKIWGEENHAIAAMALARTLNISGKWRSGSILNGYIFIRETFSSIYHS